MLKVSHKNTYSSVGIYAFAALLSLSCFAPTLLDAGPCINAIERIGRIANISIDPKTSNFFAEQIPTRLTRILSRTIDRLPDEAIAKGVKERFFSDLSECIGSGCTFTRTYNGLILKGKAIWFPEQGELQIRVTHLFPTNVDLRNRTIRAALANASLHSMLWNPALGKLFAFGANFFDFVSATGGAHKGLGKGLINVVNDLFLNSILVAAENSDKINTIRLVGDTIVNRKLYELLSENGFTTVKEVDPYNQRGLFANALPSLLELSAMISWLTIYFNKTSILAAGSSPDKKKFYWTKVKVAGALDLTDKAKNVELIIQAPK